MPLPTEVGGITNDTRYMDDSSIEKTEAVTHITPSKIHADITCILNRVVASGAYHTHAHSFIHQRMADTGITPLAAAVC